MNKYFEILVLGFLSLGVSGDNAVTPRVVLFDGVNQTGISKVISKTYVPNMTAKKFNNKARSACVNGTWLFYNNLNYNNGIKRAEMEYFSGKSFCSNFKHIGGKVSSLRFVGSAVDYTSDSITIYAGPYFQGDEEFLTQSAKHLSILSNTTLSLIVTGRRGWTIYDQAEYKGNSICITSDNLGDFPNKFVTDTTLVKKFSKIKSVRLGCYFLS